MVVVILKTSEYTKADRYSSEKYVQGDKVVEQITVSDKSVKRVYIVKVSSPYLMILKNATKTPRYLYSASGARGLHNYPHVTKYLSRRLPNFREVGAPIDPERPNIY